MNKSNLITDSALGVRRLAQEHPEWLPVLEAAVAVATSVEDEEFAGASVVDELARRGLPRWIPNLRIFVSYGLLEKSGPSTRGGRRAYYRMPDRTGIEKALDAWRTEGRQEPAKKLRFIAAGDSNEMQADTARRAGEMPYKPRSWR